ncbi:MAG: MipA/OmpV family protein [Pseudomonadota bacterium]
MPLKRHLFRCGLFLAAIMSIAPAHAQAPGQRPPGAPAGPPPDSLTVGLGAAIAPRFPGADEYAPLPFPSFEYRFNGRTLRNSGFGFEVDLTKGSTLDFGPIVRINGGRDDLNSASDPVIEALGQVSLTAEVGAFIATTRPMITSRSGPPILFTARASIVQALGGHDGFIVEGSAGFIRPSRTWTFIGLGNISYVSGDYNDAFFSVNAAQSQASGLQEFDADSGLRDIGATGIARYQISPKWSVTSLLNYARLLDEASNSPIVTERGSPNQLFFGINVAYKIF